MRRGTKVGQAYVAITADGSTINDDIADSLEGADFDGLGRKYGENLRRGFESRHKEIAKNFREMMRKEIPRAIEIESQAAKNVEKMITGTDRMNWIHPFMKEVGRRSGVEFGGEFSDAIKAAVHRRLRGALLDAELGGDSELSSLVKRFSSGLLDEEGNEIMLSRLGPALDEAAREVRKIADENQRLIEEENKNRLRGIETAARLGKQMRDMEWADTERINEARTQAAKLSQRVQVESAKIAERRARDERNWVTLLERAHRMNREFDAARVRSNQQNLALLERAHRMNREFDASVAQADRFLRTATRAREMISTLRLGPQIDRRSILEFENKLQKMLERRDAAAYRLQVEADLKPGERLKLEREIESIDAEVKVRLDPRRARLMLAQMQGGIGGFESTLGARVGRYFGRGSRANILNLLGRSIGNVIDLVPRLTNYARGMASTFSQGFAQAAAGATTFQRVLSGLGAVATRMGAGLAAGLRAGAVIVPIIITMFSALTSVLSSLTAIVTALASTIVSGLTGGVMVLGGVLATAATSAGLLVTAFTSMTDFQAGRLKDQFRPLKEILTGIGQVMLRDILPATSQWAGNLREALGLLAPLASVMGSAFAQAGNILTSTLSGPGFQAFMRAMTADLPRITTSMSSALGGFLNAMMGVFAALTPYVRQFADYLDRTMRRFSEWANSTGGQNAILDFTERAVRGLMSLWNFVREFSGAIRDLLFNPTTQEFGNSMFDYLADSFHRFREAIARGDLEQWFADAIEFGGSLWTMLTAIGETLRALYDSGTLKAVGMGFEAIAKTLEYLNMLLEPLIDSFGRYLPSAFNAMIAPLEVLKNTIISMVEGIQYAIGVFADKIPGLGGKISGDLDTALKPWKDMADRWGEGIQFAVNGPTQAPVMYGPKAPSAAQLAAHRARNMKLPSFNLGSLQSLGRNALAATDVEPVKWKNPYVAWAESLIDDGPTMAEQIRQAVREVDKMARKALRSSNREMVRGLRQENRAAADAIRAAVAATDADSVVSALSGAMDSMRDASKSLSKSLIADARSTAKSMRDDGKSMVDAARRNLNSAAQALASATTPGAANKALAQVQEAQRQLGVAQSAQTRMNKQAQRVIERARKNAEQVQKRARRANAILARQEVLSTTKVDFMVRGIRVSNATLADYAEARARVADKLEEANQKLAEAIQIRDSYRSQIAESIRSFGALTGAQAKVIDGIQQTLTHSDITDHLRDRLTDITKFQADLRALLGQGLSQEAYKQILDMGVGEGSAYASALLQGGAGAISQTNALVAQIGAVGDSLGLEASNHLYQAGVSAAEGLVKGLESQAAQLDSAAARLGKSIAKAVARELGIRSPSTVMDNMMDYVGDGQVRGLDRQHAKVASAAARLASQVAVSPEVASYAAQQNLLRSAGVSGNVGHDIDLHVTTPTTNPKAVAIEAVNELIGRL